MAKLEASVLAFERKLANSDALMYAGNWDERDQSNSWEAIKIQEKAVRGTISNRLKTANEQDPTKLNQKIESPNPQIVDVAALPFEKDTLKLSFTLRILGDLSTPSACNNPDYQEALASKINQYIEEHGFGELASRYAENLANGRFLWRNRVGAEQVEVRIKHLDQEWVFDSHDFNLRQFSSNNSGLNPLTEVIKKGLTSESYVLLTVHAFVKLGQGQEVFPSQELILDKGKGDKSKVLYQVDGVAALHSQKVGNALRTIDTWYPDAGDLGPIAVEPYGSVTNRGKAYRQPTDKMDFYNLLDNWIGKDKTPDVKQQHYVIATLIRGGVFGKAD
ncbi:CRISPR-associated protein, Csy3 family [Desulfurispirillum indicum S5]|uniref:CRISPR-associated protein, Csy3 family n=1 Tax=Desulfurispirillum indicum (strain ATCC BAA-1389 / DSM 22839 / S5) TaxID=653733 RepID=E6W303_DESIS|nr:type I-F CRISPR-associated protein Csy3 [Desulfurispirillum indicum]ADU65664.1 CRISPR-associated protein, Csy3 family [Desulfurispirillum indicum S5]